MINNAYEEYKYYRDRELFDQSLRYSNSCAAPQVKLPGWCKDTRIEPIPYEEPVKKLNLLLLLEDNI